MRSRPLLAVVLLTLLLGQGLAAQQLPTAPPEQLGLAPDRLEQIVALVQDAVDQNEVAGAVTLVARLGRVGHLEAVGLRDIERGAPMQTDTLFRIASMTKAVTSVAVMQLYESGALMLTDPVSTYLPAFDEMEVLSRSGGGGSGTLEPANPITIRHLLTHTSGLSYRFLSPPQLAPQYIASNISDGLSQTDGTIGEMVDTLAALPLAHQPGARFTYGLSVDVLGRVIEIVTGQTLAEYMAAEIFGPLGMVDTAFYVDPEEADRFASIYRPGTEGIRKIPNSPVVSADRRTIYSAGYPYGESQTYFSGGAGLSSTI